MSVLVDEDIGGEGPDVVPTSEPGQVLEQDGPDPLAVVAVGHQEGDLRLSRPVDLGRCDAEKASVLPQSEGQDQVGLDACQHCGPRSCAERPD
jgi:hypothetical protein